MKITAIMSGGDWYDASVHLLVLPEGTVAEDLYRDYKEWYREWSSQHLKEAYRSFPEWLMEFHCAVHPTEEDLEEFWEE